MCANFGFGALVGNHCLVEILSGTNVVVLARLALQLPVGLHDHLLDCLKASPS
jgi:hypothetical protein